MTTFYVATLACYVLVEADSEAEAQYRGHDALRDLYADARQRQEDDAPIRILTVRPATEDEIEFWNWHSECAARELDAGGSGT
jgi:hypothetical protein